MDYIAHQAPLSVGFFRQEYCSGCPFFSSRDLPDPGIEPGSPTLQADSLLSEPPGEPQTVSSDNKWLSINGLGAKIKSLALPRKRASG